MVPRPTVSFHFKKHSSVTYIQIEEYYDIEYAKNALYLIYVGSHWKLCGRERDQSNIEHNF